MKSTRGLLFGVLLMLAGMPASAREWYILPHDLESPTAGDSWGDATSLRYAVFAAADGDTLLVRAAIYNVMFTLETDKSLTIIAIPEGDVTRALFRASDADRVFVFRSDGQQSVLLQGIDMANANAGKAAFRPRYGGAIYVGSSTSLTLEDATLSDNKATSDAVYGYGGAIYNEGKLHLKNVCLSGNVASEKGAGYGGALYNSGTVSISGGTKFQNNSASRRGEMAAQAKGGAIYSAGAGSRVQIEGTREGEVIEANGVFFVENIAGEIVDESFEQWELNDRIAYGGAIFGTDGTVLDIAGARFQGNKASLSNMIGKGGAIYVDEKVALSVYNAVFANNIAAKGRGTQVAYGAGYGGAICLLDEGKNVAAADTPRVNVERSLFHGNIASNATAGWGGAVYGIGAYRSANTDYTENVADSSLWDGYGGAIYIPHGVTFIIEDALFSGNVAVVRGVGNKGYGGAIWTAGSLHLKNVTMEKNVASKGVRLGHGGAIYLTQTQTQSSTTTFYYPYGKLYFEGKNLFKGNVALWGGAEEPTAADDFVFPAFGGAIAVEGSTWDGSFITPIVTLNSNGGSIYFEENVAAKGIGNRAGGGAIGVYGANVTVGDDLYEEDIVFRNNVAADNVNNPSSAYGGAIMIVKGSGGNMEGLTLFAPKFFGNVATMSLTGEGRGGAVADAGGQFINISRGRFEANYANGNEASTGNAWGGAFASFCPGNGWSSASEINFGGESLIAIGHDDGPPLCNNMATLG
ncbi:MAG: hypothetical protein LBB27_00640, partial [Tannerellaceae bacterium]|nr:hypothetical protein [Tannerellaceae bacterium]